MAPDLASIWTVCGHNRAKMGRQVRAGSHRCYLSNFPNVSVTATFGGRHFPLQAHAAQLSQIVDLRDYISQTLICESLTLALTLSATSASAYLRSTPQGVGRRSIECMDARNGINSFGSRNSARGAEKTSSDAGEVRR